MIPRLNTLALPGFNLPHLPTDEPAFSHISDGIRPLSAGERLIQESLHDAVGIPCFAKSFWAVDRYLGDSSAVVLSTVRALLAKKETPAATLLCTLFRAHLAEGNLDRAKTALETAEKSTTPTSDEWCDIARCYREIGLTDRVFEACDRAVSADDRNPFAYLERGITFAASGKTDYALRDFQFALKHRNLPSIHLHLAIFYRDQPKCRDLKLAQQHFSHAFNLLSSGKIPPVYFYERALYYIQVGSLAAAEHDIEQAIVRDPRAELFNERGLIHEWRRDFAAALRDYQQALDRSPHKKNAVSFLRRGRTYFKMGRFDEAIQNLDASLAADPSGDIVLWTYRGRALAELGKYEEALRDFEKALSIDPRDNETLFARSLAYVRAGHYQEALSDLELILSKPKEEIDDQLYLDTFELRALVYSLSHQHDLALDHYTHLLTYGRATAAVYHRYGVSLRHVGRTGEALVAFAKSHQLYTQRRIFYPQLYLDWFEALNTPTKDVARNRQTQWFASVLGKLGDITDIQFNRLEELQGLAFEVRTKEYPFTVRTRGLEKTLLQEIPWRDWPVAKPPKHKPAAPAYAGTTPSLKRADTVPTVAQVVATPQVTPPTHIDIHRTNQESGVFDPQLYFDWILSMREYHERPLALARARWLKGTIVNTEAIILIKLLEAILLCEAHEFDKVRKLLSPKPIMWKDLVTTIDDIMHLYGIRNTEEMISNIRSTLEKASARVFSDTRRQLDPSSTILATWPMSLV